MLTKFTKMQGLGNDFVVLEKLQDDGIDLRPFAKKICDRRFGIGCDQLLVIRPSREADFKMEIFNADGGEVEMCGNGIRCVAQYLFQHGLTKKQDLAIETLAGIMRPKIMGDLVEVDMGEPILEGQKIPTMQAGRLVEHPLAIDDQTYALTCVSMGNPHAILFVDSVESAPVTTLGPILEVHPMFPKRSNIEFIQAVRPDHLKMRVWERGAGETLACGTGACAALVASVLTGRSERAATLELRGGNLQIVWSEKDNHVYMTGPGVEVFRGEIQLEG